MAQQSYLVEESAKALDDASVCGCCDNTGFTNTQCTKEGGISGLPCTECHSYRNFLLAQYTAIAVILAILAIAFVAMS